MWSLKYKQVNKQVNKHFRIPVEVGQVVGTPVGELGNLVEELGTLVGELGNLVEELGTLVGDLGTLVEELGTLVGDLGILSLAPVEEGMFGPEDWGTLGLLEGVHSPQNKMEELLAC